MISSLISRVLNGKQSFTVFSDDQKQVINDGKHEDNRKVDKLTVDMSSTAMSVSRCADTCGTVCKSDKGFFSILPNEAIALILNQLSFEDLSIISITNKWFRDFVINYFIKGNTGFSRLMSQYMNASNAKNTEQQENRIKVFKSLGLLLKRSTCLLPTHDRIFMLIQIINRLDGIPSPTMNATENFVMRFIFQCYGRLIHRLIAGWDDCECNYVFDVLQSITHMEQRVNTLFNSAVGARQTLEYYVRSFYRNICIDPLDKNERYRDRIFWMSLILKPHTLLNRAKLMIITFGPLISVTPSPGTLPYIGWWDMTDTFFIQNGLEELGFAIHILYRHNENTIWNKQNVLSLFERIIALPENWVHENISTLLFFSGEEITQHFLESKLLDGKYTEAAQLLVYQTLVIHKMTNETTSALELIEKLASKEHKVMLLNELSIGFNEAVADIDNLIELEDERDVTELHEMVSSLTHLLKTVLFKYLEMSTTKESDSESDSVLFNSVQEE